ncbi:DUF3006 family protein [Halorubrum sp. SD626R]|uniref:DUF3006 family protein n=1 Tax=Halorubrum sp. SD626R TaxID=1419722 RepID=UPI000AD1C972|nr:DUF3006 family protein [Halorubrum sp. SD626R]TKX81292.1 DUF3006 domain-containing protein [Halorubrum sp. SD626R]
MTTIDLPDGEYTAVVDSIEDGLATVFFEQDGEEVGNAVLDPGELPADGRHAEAILTVEVHDGDIFSVEHRSEQTKTRSDTAQERFNRLSERPPSDTDS